MRSARRTVVRNWRHLSGLILFAVCTFAAGQDRAAQVLILKDPTPREPDLDKRFITTTPSPNTNAGRLAAFNRQRFLLITQASAHMSTLAVALEASLAQQQDATSVPREMMAARAIEELATNVYTSMTIGMPRPENSASKSSGQERQPGTSAVSGAKTDLLSESHQLTARVRELQAEIGKTNANILPLGVMIKSAQVRDEAKTLKASLAK